MTTVPTEFWMGCTATNRSTTARAEYARGGVHTNTIEGEFSVLRPWLSVFRGVSKEKLFLYCSQYQFLRRTRAMDRAARAVSLFGLTEHRNEANLFDRVPPVVNSLVYPK